jgi:hypothetical protein
MVQSSVTFSRRALVLALAGSAFAAQAARAAPSNTFPGAFAVARLGRQGLVSIGAKEQAEWDAMQLRLGGLVSRIEPLQPFNMLGMAAPENDGGASSAQAARQMAANAGFSFVALYSTHDGLRNYTVYDNWASRAYVSLKRNLGPRDRAAGEAHLLDVNPDANGGAPVLSIYTDAASRHPLNVFDGRNVQRDTMRDLTTAMERRLQSLARPAYEAQASIAD